LVKRASRENVVATAAGHEIVLVEGRFGLLHYVDGTGKAFPALESAIEFAEGMQHDKATV